MNRQMRIALAMATLAAGVGPAFGQLPAASGPVYVMKTAGQPERRVQVVKSEALADGSIVTDVKDLATGTVYTLTNPAFLGKPAATPNNPTTTPHPTTTAPTPVPTPVIAPGTPRPLFGQFPNQRMANANPFPAREVKERLVPVEQSTSIGLPQARDRKTDPLLGGATTPAAMTARTPFPTVKVPNEPPSVMGKLLNDPLKHQPPPRVGTLPPGAPVAMAATNPKPATGHPGVTVVVPTSGPAVLPEPAKPAKPPVVAPMPSPAAKPESTIAPQPTAAPPKPTDVALAIPSIDASAKPSAATGLFDSQAANTGVVLPTIAEPAPAAAPTVIAVPAIPTEPAKTAPTAIAVPAIEIPPVGPDRTTAPAAELSRDARLRIDDLKNHKRPSFRMEQATEIAESAYARHPEALAALVHAAANDKAGVVRGHCIARLADLGYAEPAYLKQLDAWCGDLEPAVQRAAVAAKAKLAR
jgi:hypothetical protein